MKKELSEKIEIFNSLLGCIKYNSQYSFYLMPIAWWILDYKKYDPKGSSKDDFNFRNNIYTLTDNNIVLFLDSIQEDKISIEDVSDINYFYNKEKYRYDNYGKLLFFIEINKKEYISNFYDIELEDYLPEGWIGKYDNPIEYLPNNVQNIWKNKTS